MQPTPEQFGIPPEVESHPDFDEIGGNCRISDTVTVMRGPARPGRGIRLGNGVMLFRDVRLVIGSLDDNVGADIRLGNGAVVNVGSYLSGEGGLIIENDVLIGPHVSILTAGHVIRGHHEIIAKNPLSYGSVRIGAGAWVGARSVVLQGVEIGRGAVVAAGSVVTSSVASFAVVAGNPARFIHFREGFGPARWQFWRRRR